MGHLFSRAIKRLTFGAGSSASNSASRNPPSGNEQQDQAAGQSASCQRETGSNLRPTVQAIPVGQSIDSAEYAAFENASSALQSKESVQDQEIAEGAKLDELATPPQDATSSSQISDRDKENEYTEATAEPANDQSKPAVEEAVIKIQALVRGHLTRKALKDAQQQAASVAPNALGQRQFDEESLIKNPPSAIFLPSSPLNPCPPNSEATININTTHLLHQLQPQLQQQQSNKLANPRVPPLQSIAEDEVETATASQDAADSAQAPAISEQGQKRRLSARNQRESGVTSSSSNEGGPATPSSPQPPSTASASIDIHCDTPASVSIDIVDHNSKPSFGLASVLHPGPAAPNPVAEQSQEAGSNSSGGAMNDGELQRADEDEVDILPDISGIPTAGLGPFESSTTTAMATASSLPASPPHINLAAATTNSHSIDSAEAAAIRIQSAFRGYHTRKHSPYRRRSPASVPAPQTNGFGGGANGNHVRRNLLRQQDATAMDDGCDEEEEADAEANDDEGFEGCERLGPSSALHEGAVDEAGEEKHETDAARERLQEQATESAIRQSRQRHRADETAQLAGELASTSLDNDTSEAVALVDDDRHRSNELESDDVERRDPSGHVSEDHMEESPQISTDLFDQQPALVSSSSFEDDQRRQSLEGPSSDLEQQRLEVVSPDEAIGSGRSSPALVSSNGENSSEDEAGYQEEEGEVGRAAQTGGESPQQGGSGGGGGGGGGNGGNKNKKRNRNKRNKGKK